MSSDFKITLNRFEDQIHLKLYGDFDGSSAHELLNLIKNNSHDLLKIYIHTDDLKTIHPFGLNIFFRRYWIINGCADKIVFAGKKAPDFALHSDHCFL